MDLDWLTEYLILVCCNVEIIYYICFKQMYCWLQILSKQNMLLMLCCLSLMSKKHQ